LIEGAVWSCGRFQNLVATLLGEELVEFSRLGFSSRVFTGSSVELGGGGVQVGLGGAGEVVDAFGVVLA
jgi:hypothetical protein